MTFHKHKRSKLCYSLVVGEGLKQTERGFSRRPALQPPSLHWCSTQYFEADTKSTSKVSCDSVLDCFSTLAELPSTYPRVR